jgi:arylsulfatase A-like enzyme
MVMKLRLYYWTSHVKETLQDSLANSTCQLTVVFLENDASEVEGKMRLNRTSKSLSAIPFMALCLVLVAHNSHVESAERAPNIVWIVGENLDLDLGCYGAKNVRTPNLDRLADEGVLYTSVFATSPVCAPSRSAFMTGMYQTSTDTHHMRSHRDDDFRLPAGVRPITHRLQDAGYFTANIEALGDRVVGTGKLDLNFVNEGPIYASSDWSALRAKQPFFAQINMPEAEYDIYDRKSAEKPRVKWVGEQWHPRVATPENVTPPPYYPDHKITRAEWARYLNSVSGMDVRCGWILQQLEREGLTDDTIVIFFADNGRLEARGIHWCWDSGLHVPLIIRWPKNYPPPSQFKAGTTCDQVISLLDLTATTLWMAGIDRPAGMQSRLFLGDRADPPRSFAFSARDRIDETVIRLRSVREKRYHYIRNFTPGAGFPTLNRYKEKCFLVKPLMRRLLDEGRLEGPPKDLMQPFPDEQLYDTHADPYEIQNLADSTEPEHREALIRLRAALDTWMTETGDLGAWPEPAEIVAPFEKEMHDWFGTPAWYQSAE